MVADTVLMKLQNASYLEKSSHDIDIKLVLTLRSFIFPLLISRNNRQTLAH